MMKVFRYFSSVVCLLFVCAVCISCSVVQQLMPPDTPLRMAEPVAFTMEVDGKKVQMQIVPEKRDELVAKILQLETVKRDSEALSVSCIPGYSYELSCSIREGNEEPRACSFFVRRKTWIGNSTVYEFDARDYFTPESWNEVSQKLYDADYDGDIDERFGNNVGTPLPAQPL